MVSKVFCLLHFIFKMLPVLNSPWFSAVEMLRQLKASGWNTGEIPPSAGHSENCSGEAAHRQVTTGVVKVQEGWQSTCPVVWDPRGHGGPSHHCGLWRVTAWIRLPCSCMCGICPCLSLRTTPAFATLEADDNSETAGLRCQSLCSLAFCPILSLAAHQSLLPSGLCWRLRPPQAPGLLGYVPSSPQGLHHVWDNAAHQELRQGPPPLSWVNRDAVQPQGLLRQVPPLLGSEQLLSSPYFI